MPYHTTTDSVALLEDELKLRQDLANMDADELVEVIVRNHFDYPRVRDMREKFKKENEELKNEVRDLKNHIENLPRPHIGHMIGRNIAVQLKEAKEEIEDLKKQIVYEVGISIEKELKEEIEKLKLEIEQLKAVEERNLDLQEEVETLKETLDEVIEKEIELLK